MKVYRYREGSISGDGDPIVFNIDSISSRLCVGCTTMHGDGSYIENVKNINFLSTFSGITILVLDKLTESQKKKIIRVSLKR